MCEKHRKRMSNSLFKNVGKKKTLNPSLVPTPLSIIFLMFSLFWAISKDLVHFKWIQNFSSFSVISNLMGAVTRILQNVCLLHRQTWRIQGFKLLKILNCFNSPNIKHRILYIKHPISSSFLSQIESNFCNVESTRWKVSNVLWASEAQEQCVMIRLPLIS